MYKNNKAIIAKGEDFVNLNLNMLNRHGIITGATGTGKTITLKVIAETLSAAGIPSIITDVKGDLSGCALQGNNSESLEKRINKLGLENFSFEKYPVRFWDVFGKKGHPIRITISDLGPSLLARILNVSDSGEGILNIAFKIADKEGLELIDLKDLKSMLQYISEHADNYQMEYGNINKVSVSTIIRKLLSIETENELFFGEPKLDIKDFIHTSEETMKGYLNIIEVSELIKNPSLYATFLVWLLSSFYELLPEVGDLEKPKVVLFLDEAHLIFSEMNNEIIKKLTQIIKLIRSKGVGVFFISQLPTDIPDDILNQLGNRVQHCLHAYTPNELKAVTCAANSFRANPKFDTKQAILELSTGEALVSFVDEEGKPNIVEKATILPPQSSIGQLSDDVINSIVSNGLMDLKYRNVIDRDSAYEKISKINNEELKIQEENIKQKELEKAEAIRLKEQTKEDLKKAKETEKQNKAIQKGITKSINKVTNSAMSSIGRQLGNAIMRGILGTKK